jgi:hypothetical protein
MCSLTVLLIRVSHLLNNYYNIYSLGNSMLGILIKEMNNSSCAYEFSLSFSLSSMENAYFFSGIKEMPFPPLFQIMNFGN